MKLLNLPIALEQTFPIIYWPLSLIPFYVTNVNQYIHILALYVSLRGLFYLEFKQTLETAKHQNKAY